jgi:hypothetical protein
MTSTTDEPKHKERAAAYVYFCTLYFLTVGVLYLWGYWSAFKINILEYLELADIIKSTAYPIASVILLTVIGAALGEAMVDKSPSGGGGMEARLWSFVGRHFARVTQAYVLGALALILWAPSWMWQVLPTVLAIPISVGIMQRGALRTIVPGDRARFVVVFVLSVMPFAAYGQGCLAAGKVLSGTDYAYVVSEVPGYKSAESASRDTFLRVIGRAGEQMFLFDPAAQSVFIFKPESGKSVVVKRHPGSDTNSSTSGRNPSLKGAAADKPASSP